MNMEKENSDSKRKSTSGSSEEPPHKKLRRAVSIEDVLAPSEERNRNASRSSSEINILQDNSDNELVTSDKVSNSTSTREIKSDNTEIPSNKDCPVDDTAKSPSSPPPPPPPSSSVEEVKGIRLSSVTSADKTPNHKPLNPDDKSDEKKIKWNCAHSSNHETNLTEIKTSNVRTATPQDPQTSASSFTKLRNSCAYGSKCYRKSSGHKAKFSHPGDSDYDIKDNRPECRYGIKCYRKDPKHKQDFKHSVVRRKRAQTPVRVLSPDRYESGMDNSSAEESVDESEYNPSELDNSSDDDSSDW